MVRRLASKTARSSTGAGVGSSARVRPWKSAARAGVLPTRRNRRVQRGQPKGGGQEGSAVHGITTGPRSGSERDPEIVGGGDRKERTGAGRLLDERLSTSARPACPRCANRALDTKIVPRHPVQEARFDVSPYCRRWGSNPHVLWGHWILSPGALPVPPLRPLREQDYCVCWSVSPFCR